MNYIKIAKFIFIKDDLNVPEDVEIEDNNVRLKLLGRYSIFALYIHIANHQTSTP